MTTALSIYERMADPVAAIDALGVIIAKSQVITCGTIEQGKVFAWECLVRRTPPLMLAERYHVIFGKLAMKAEAMLDGLIRAGGKHRVICRTADRAEIEITMDGQTQNFALTWEEAQQEPFAYEGKEGDAVDKLTAHAADNKKPKPKLKAKYGTPRGRMQMMWARVVSDGVRVMCPSVNSGVYTPEEVEDSEEANGANGTTRPRAAKKADVADVPPVGVSASAADAAKDSDVIDGEFVVTPDAAKESPAVATTATPPLPAGTTEPQYATSSQLLKLEEMLDKVGASPEDREKIQRKRGVNSFRSFTIGQADELIAALAKAITAKKAAAASPPPGGTVIETPADKPAAPPSQCSAGQVNTAMQRLTELKQVNPPAFGQFVGWLRSKGKKIEQLSASDCDSLIAAAKDVKLMDDFFAKSLEEWKPVEKPADAATVAATQSADVPFETSSSKN